MCVAVLDLDAFKRYNDQRGHLAGDLLYAEAAEAWRTELRGGDVLARYGGDEFAALIPGRPIETALAVIERLRRATPHGSACSRGRGRLGPHRVRDRAVRARRCRALRGQAVRA